MTDQKQPSLRTQIENLKRSFLQFANTPLIDILSTDWLKKLSDSVPCRSDTIYTPLVVLRLFLLQVLNQDGSCKAAVARFLIERIANGETEVSNSSGPYCVARKRLPLDLLMDAVREIAAQVINLGNMWTWYGYDVYMVDGTTVLLPDTEENQDEFPQQKNQKPGLGFPIVRLCALISLATGTLVDYALAPYEGKGTGETSLFSRMMGPLNKGSLLLADRYYATFAIITLLFLKDVPVLMINHAKRIVDYSTGTVLGKNDHLIEWIKPVIKPIWMTQEDYDKLPNSVIVREFRVKGIDYVTTLLDHKKFNKKEMADLYQQRWNVEVDLRSLKTYMGMEMLGCLTPEMIKKEIAVYFMAYNLIRSIIAQSAIIHEKHPRNISFAGAVQLIVAGATNMVNMVIQFTIDMVNIILHAISTNTIGNRKQPTQPRAIKRRPKPYPLLMMPRAEAVEILNNQGVT